LLQGCDISREFEKKLGGIVELDGGWIVNHYAGPEGFLGWLALQPRYHKKDFASLEKNETEALGRNIQNIDMALRQYWSIRFPEDPIEKVYLVYFHESEEYHLHIHIISRSRKLGQDNPSEKAAWKICTLAPCWNNFPEEYRLRAKETKGNDNLIHKEEVVALMTHLKGYLWVIPRR